MTVHLNFLFILLTGLTGIHIEAAISVVSVTVGDSFSMPCPYDSEYINHVKYLCKENIWRSCSHLVNTNQQNSRKYSISDDKSQRIFTVTIKDLTDTDAGYYQYAVENNEGSGSRGYFQLSVTRGTPRLYVDHQEIAGFKGDDITLNCHYSNSGQKKWCRLGSSCVTRSSGLIFGTRVTINEDVPSVFTVTMSGLRTESSGWYWCVKGDFFMPVHVTVTERPTSTTATKCLTTVASTAQVEHRSSPSDHLKSFSIRLSVLIFVIMVALFIWFMFKRHKQTKASATTTAEGEVTYSNAEFMRQTSDKRSHAESDVEDEVL